MSNLENTKISFESNPTIEDKNFTEYIRKINDKQLADKIMNELEVKEGEKDYYKDLYNKTRNFILKEKEKFYFNKFDNFFNDKPYFNFSNIHTYLILAGAPFVEKSKQDKFKVYLTTKSILIEFAKIIVDIIFPYEDTDKATLEPNSIIILKLRNAEDVNIVKQSVNGKFIMKNNQVFALTINEYKDFCKKNILTSKVDGIKDSFTWEEQNLQEYYIQRSADKFTYNKFHFFTKEAKELSVERNIDINSSLSWSPQGTYLIKQTSTDIIFYSGSSNLIELFKISDSCQKFLVSNDERYMITFLGLGSTNIITNPTYIKDLITRQNVSIWDLVNQTIIKTIKISHEENFDNFKWSDNSKFLSRLKGDVVIVYEAPSFKMLYDSKVDKRHPFVDKVTSYSWFPESEYIMTLTEIRKNKQIESTINFYQVPNRIQCSLSIPFKNITVESFKWHPNNKTLLLLLKTLNLAEWSLKIIDFNFSNFTHKNKSYELIKPVVKSTNAIDEEMTEKDIDYNSADVHWINNGSEILLTAKKRLLIPLYSQIEKKFINTDEGRSFSFFLYSYNQKDMKIAELANKKKMKYNEILVSPNSKNILLFNKIPDCKNMFGEAVLFVVENGKFYEVTKMSFGENFKNVSFDNSGRFFCLELNRVSANITVGFKLFFISGELLVDMKDSTLIDVSNKYLYII